MISNAVRKPYDLDLEKRDWGYENETGQDPLQIRKKTGITH